MRGKDGAPDHSKGKARLAGCSKPEGLRQGNKDLFLARCSARAIAHAYSVFATGGQELGLREETLRELTAPAIPPTHGFYDEVMKGEVQFSLGFMKSSPSCIQPRQPLQSRQTVPELNSVWVENKAEQSPDIHKLASLNSGVEYLLAVYNARRQE